MLALKANWGLESPNQGDSSAIEERTLLSRIQDAQDDLHRRVLTTNRLEWCRKHVTVATEIITIPRK
eukprot:506172-Amphidinium_carterae.1